MRNLLIFLFIFGLLTSPLYLLPSGSIQIYHAALAMMSLLVLFHSGGLKPKPVIVLAVTFWAYEILRQSLYIMANVEADIATLLYPTLNMAVFIGVYMVLSDAFTPHKTKWILRAIGAVLAFELGYIIFENGSLSFFMHSENRSTGTFNNPNQLGYFSVLMGCAYVSLSNSVERSKWSEVLVVSLAYVLAAISLSKAAMLSIAPLLLFSIASRIGAMRSKLLRAFIVVTGIVLLGLLAVIFVSQFDGLRGSDNAVIRRLALVGSDSDDTLVARGYALILNPDTRIIFGYGEGYYTKIFGKEVHSTLANVLTSFGLVGFALFGGLILYVVQFRLFSFHSGLVGLVLAYSLTHNGMRNTLFWVFLATIAWSVQQVQRTKQEEKARISVGRAGAGIRVPA